MVLPKVRQTFRRENENIWLSLTWTRTPSVWFHSILNKSLLLPNIFASTPPDGTVDGSLGITVSDIMPFVIEFFASTKPDLQLDARPLEIQLQRNDRKTPLLDSYMQIVDLFSIKEKLPYAKGVYDPLVAVGIWRYVHVFNEYFFIAEGGETVGDVDPSLPYRLDLVSMEHYSAFEGFEDLIFVPGAAVRGDHLHLWLFSFFRHL